MMKFSDVCSRLIERAKTEQETRDNKAKQQANSKQTIVLLESLNHLAAKREIGLWIMRLMICSMHVLAVISIA